MEDFHYATDVGSSVPTRMAAPQGEITLVYRFGTAEWVNNKCQWRPGSKIVHGCAVLDEESGHCVAFLVEPRSFQDIDRLAVIGHELWHCFGAKHAQGGPAFPFVTPRDSPTSDRSAPGAYA